MVTIAPITSPSILINASDRLINRTTIKFGYVEDDPKTTDLLFKDNAYLAYAPLVGEISLKRFFKNVSQQYHLGSCVANAVADAFEAKQAMKLNISPEMIKNLSRLFIYWNARNLEYPPRVDDNGTRIRLGFDCVCRYGVPYEDGPVETGYWPYDTTKVNVRPTILSYREAIKNRLSGFYRIDATGDDRLVQVIKALSSGHPVVFGTKLASSFRLVNSEAVIQPPTNNYIGGHAMCCLPNTMIITENGIKAIKDIKIFDSVLTRNGYKSVNVLSVRNVNEKIYKIHSQLSVTPLEVTKEHPILVKKCSPLTKKSPLNMNKFDFIEAKDIKRGYYVKTKIDTKIIENDISKDFARLLGYYIGDGNLQIAKSKNGNIKSIKFRLTYHRKDKREIIEDLINIVEKEYPGTKYSIYEDKKSNTNIISFYNTNLGKRILNLCGRAKNKTIEKLLYIEPEKQKELLFGWFKTDGTAKWLETTNIFTAEENLANELVFILQRCKLIYSVNTIDKGTCTINNRVYNTKGGYRVYFHNKTNKDRMYYENDEIISRINKIESIDYGGLVYNFEVDDTHEYIANNIITHNCITGWSETRKAFEIRNSWGTGWGVNGYCYMSPNYIKASITRDLWVPTL